MESLTHIPFTDVKVTPSPLLFFWSEADVTLDVDFRTSFESKGKSVLEEITRDESSSFSPILPLVVPARTSESSVAMEKGEIRTFF